MTTFRYADVEVLTYLGTRRIAGPTRITGTVGFVRCRLDALVDAAFEVGEELMVHDLTTGNHIFTMRNARLHHIGEAAFRRELADCIALL